jgi:uncharacterized protein (DUF2252 family)
MAAATKSAKGQKGDALPQTCRLSVEARIAIGKALRDKCPREHQARWNPRQKGRDPVDILIKSSRGRVEKLIPIRYGRMMVSPFAFYRGAAAGMAFDLAATPSTGVNAQVCGDCHLMNFGGFATPERKLIFDINDFDETSVAPWEWDVKRLAASMVVAGRSNGFKEPECRDAAWDAVNSYHQHMKEFAKMPTLDAWYLEIGFDEIMRESKDPRMRRFEEAQISKATKESAHVKEYVKLTVEKGHQPKIKDQPPLIYHDRDSEVEATRERFELVYAQYRNSLAPERRVLIDRFELKDTAVKVVGVGSVGTQCGVILFVSGKGDPLFLQFKEARESVLEPYAGASPYDHSGERVVVGQRLMQAASDIFLGWFTGRQGRHFYARQLHDAKISAVLEVMKPSDLSNYGRICGWALAKAHVRSGDSVLLNAYLGKSEVFEDAVANFAVSYADQNEKDHAALIRAVRAGRLRAEVVN